MGPRTCFATWRWCCCCNLGPHPLTFNEPMPFWSDSAGQVIWKSNEIHGHHVLAVFVLFWTSTPTCKARSKHHQTSKTFLGVLEFATTALLHCHHRQSLEMDATMDSQHFLQRALRLLRFHELEPDDTPDTGADGETGETEQSRLSVGSNVTHATQVAARLQRENTMFPDTEVEERRCRQLQRIWLGTPSGRWLWSLNGNWRVFVHPRVLGFWAGWCKWFFYGPAWALM